MNNNTSFPKDLSNVIIKIIEATTYKVIVDVQYNNQPITGLAVNNFVCRGNMSLDELFFVICIEDSDGRYILTPVLNFNAGNYIINLRTGNDAEFTINN